MKRLLNGLIVAVVIFVPIFAVSAQTYDVTAPTAAICASTQVTILYSASVALGASDEVLYEEFVDGAMTGSGQEFGPGSNGFFTTRVSDVFSAVTNPYTFVVRLILRSASSVIKTYTITADCPPPTSLASSISFSVTRPSTAEIEEMETLASGVVFPPDDRLNWQYGDTHIGILYPNTLDSVDLYIYETQQYFGAWLTTEDLQDYLETPPVQNTLIKSQGPVSAYVLTTGEIQFNFVDAEGKIFVYITEDLTGLNDYGYYIDPLQS